MGQLEQALKAAADPTRTRILKLPEGGPLCVCRVQAVLADRRRLREVRSVLLALGAQWVGQAFRVMTRIEKAMRAATGVAFLAAGAYLAATHILGLSF